MCCRNAKGNQHNFVDAQLRLLMMFHLENLRSSMEPLHLHHIHLGNFKLNLESNLVAVTKELDIRAFQTSIDDVNIYRLGKTNSLRIFT